MRRSPAGIRFNDAVRVAKHYFGQPRVAASHHIFSMPWPGDPRVNLQDTNGKAKPYQVRQLVEAIDKMNLLRNESEG